SGLVRVENPRLEALGEDVLYHLDLGTKTHDLPATSGDIKFVCVGGSPNRMRAFAQLVHKELGLEGDGEELADVCVGTDRYAECLSYCLFSQQHGMGIPSTSIMLHELIELLHHAKCRDVTTIRIGTSGGLEHKHQQLRLSLRFAGVEAGSVVITDRAVAARFQPRFEQVVLGDAVLRGTDLDGGLVEGLLDCSKGIPDVPALVGHTMCTYDFYEEQWPASASFHGQGRSDGALRSFSSGKKLEHLKRAQAAGVRNTEVEPTAPAALSG
ncbi:UPP2 phosphorylase, partial [Alectura lathami]|nr:UPP2 phosphorylase [Alectura lathami]